MGLRDIGFEFVKVLVASFCEHFFFLSRKTCISFQRMLYYKCQIVTYFHRVQWRVLKTTVLNLPV